MRLRAVGHGLRRNVRGRRRVEIRRLPVDDVRGGRWTRRVGLSRLFDHRVVIATPVPT